MLTIDKNLMNYTEVQELHEFLTLFMVTDYKIHEFTVKNDLGIEYKQLAFDFTTYSGRKYTIHVTGLVTHNANVLVENVRDFLGKE